MTSNTNQHRRRGSANDARKAIRYPADPLWMPKRKMPTANAAGRDGSEEAFDEALRKVARRRPDERPPRSPQPKG